MHGFQCWTMVIGVPGPLLTCVLTRTPVRGDIVLPVLLILSASARNVRIEERDGGTCNDRRVRRRYRCRNHHPLRIDEVQFATVMAPGREHAASCRDLPPTAGRPA